MRRVHDWIETSQLLKELQEVYIGLKTNNPKKEVCLEVNMRSVSITISGATVFKADKEMDRELWGVHVDEKIADAFYYLNPRLVY